MLKINCNRLIFFVLSIFNVIVSLWFGVNYITYVEVVFLVGLVGIKKIKNIEFLLYSLFVPNKYLQLLSVLIYLIFSGKILFKRIRKQEFVFMIYIIVFGILNCLMYDGLIISTLFQIGVYYCLLRLMDDFGTEIEFKGIYEFLDHMFILQIITLIIDYIYYGNIGDCMTGTLISAHYLAVFLLIYIYIVLKMIHTNVLKSRRILRVTIALICLILSDAKHVWIVFILAAIIAKCFWWLKIKNKVTVSILTMSIIVVSFVVFSQTYESKSVLEKNKFAYTYVYNKKYNKKLEFFFNTFNEMKGIKGLVGFGVGQYGSQICITMAKGQIYSWNNQLAKYKYAIGPYERAIKGLMTEEYSLFGIGNSSMVMGYPLVSFVGMVAELGIIGFIMFLRIIDRRYKEEDVTFLLAFFMMSLFDTYLEIPCIFVLILVATYVNRESKNISA